MIFAFEMRGFAARLALVSLLVGCATASEMRAQAPETIDRPQTEARFAVRRILHPMARPQKATAEKSLVENPSFNNSNSISAVNAALAPYFDAEQGASSTDLINRALASNGELAAARLEATQARARLRGAGLRPNPTLDFEQTTGRLTGSSGESQTSIGIAVPLEIGGRRRQRTSLAQAELEAVEADIANRERLLAVEVRALYAEALAALRELETTADSFDLNLQIVRVVQTRVNEGETPPLELNLLQTEVERLRSRRALVEGRLRASLIRLRSTIGGAQSVPLQLSENLNNAASFTAPASLDAAIEIALRTRPDLQLARLNEQVAQAGLQLARANALPDVTAFARYNQNRSSFDSTPIGILRDRDRTLTFGASISLPVFNKNQAAKAEATTAIEQARTRREFGESVIRAEVTAAYARLEAARLAVSTFERGVIDRSNANLQVIRAAYDLGEFRITDLINEQRRLVDSQREFTEALAEQYRAAAEVQAAIGVPVEPQP